MAYPRGEQTVGREAIRRLWEAGVAHAPHFAPEEPRSTDPAVVSTGMAFAYAIGRGILPDDERECDR